MTSKRTESKTPETGPTKETADRAGKGDAGRSLTPEQIEFAKVLGDCIARQWMAKQNAKSSSDGQDAIQS